MISAEPELLEKAAVRAAAHARACSSRFESVPHDEFVGQMSACLAAVLAHANDQNAPAAKEWIETHARRRAAAGFSAADAVCGFAAARGALRHLVSGQTRLGGELAAEVERAVDEVQHEFVSVLEGLRYGEADLDRAQAARLAEVLAQPIVLLDCDGRAAWATAALARLCNQSLAAIVGERALELIPIVAAAFADPPAVERSLRSSAARPDRSHSDVYRTADGAWLACSSLPIGDHRYAGRLITFSDVTQFVEASQHAQQLSRALVNAQERERAHIAGELHDGPVQLLAAALMRLDPSLATPTDGDDVGVEALRADLRCAYREIRSLLFNLRPQTLTQHGLAAAARDVATKLEEAAGVRVHIENHCGAVRRDEQAVVAFRVLQEALANVRKHADAREVHVILDGDDDLVLMIRDDGRGFPVDDARSRVGAGHIGLATMRERVELAGGKFVLASRPGGGTQVTVWLPPAAA